MRIHGIFLGISSKTSVAFIPPCAIRWNQSGVVMTSLRSTSARAAASSSSKYVAGGNGRQRRLIVDTDLGLDDLVALAILRVQQCMNQQSHHLRNESNNNYTPFHLSGVTITTGISCASVENVALLRRLLPPDTPVYVGGDGDTSLPWMNEDKPTWWTRTAQRVTSFLSALPPLPMNQSTGQNNISAEQFIANNIDDPNVDFLCMAPLSTVARALDIRSEQESNNGPPKATFFIMGGIQSDSKVTKRGESTAPFGYHDIVGEATSLKANGVSAIDKQDQFGEFNFALDIMSARKIFSTISTCLIPVEACTLVPASLGPSSASVTLSSFLSRSQYLKCSSEGITNSATDSAKELETSQSILLKLLQEHGTTETQWDSIAAAIYCNAFDSACVGDSALSATFTKVNSREMSLSHLGALSFPGCESNERPAMCDDFNDRDHDHWIYPDFSIEDESIFFRYLSFLSYGQ
ncbi:hypothetical protein ACHAXR_010812 [Thalassiosira sp. AJA248-18]